MHEFIPQGTCSSKILFDIQDGKVKNLHFEDGCDGNLKALSILADGMEAGELVKKLKGLECEDKGTSCADQLARALEKYSNGAFANS
ncbi:TIGR03905 family TSCPD domain-containing protein [Leadbettera azotonutricia]|uniref:ribonucleoside-diphosphate reductase n=1 Tax=Leadbettera azotonutricia (strain ATCC BAA-888 / DSM 13862 / ZAS-9) TaxID=545695 RepID=F5YBR8_LEAAZ|nr:TIGR03905 family TSCPD domain-containing protein [Leadbettera azotonutricia]AEF82287.1 conserved hypothetical protein [Leadbettera azotonutricia ZAS-9]